jgi:ATPase subunit of ABC transporter with duplicated ATPase domains
MISTSELTIQYGSRKLFENVSIKFSPENCYGVIGANGAGKSTFVKALSRQIEPTKGSVHIPKDIRVSVLKQDHFQFNDYSVIDTVLMGNERLKTVAAAREELYAKPEMSDEDGILAAELESEFAALGGWEAETDAATLLHGLGIKEELLYTHMRDLKDAQKVKVLLAQALFGSPDVLILDEPTNHLDARSIHWLENYLLEYKKTVIVISHDRHFLNKVCTHMVDIDCGQVKVYVGNYDFWEQSSLLARNLLSSENKKKEQKAKELETFIQRFSANASKSKQATSRRKQLESLTLDDIPQSIRKKPHILFVQEREAGDILLEVDGLSKTVAGEKLFSNVSFSVRKGDKIVLVGDNELAATALFEVLMGKTKADSGTFRWGVTTSQAYLPKQYDEFFSDNPVTLVEWLREFSTDKSEVFLRGYLGKMLFSGQETLKKTDVLSGGEKVRCMIARMMLKNANILLFDGPTNHLDLESITALNNAIVDFKGTVLLATHDHLFAESTATRLIELTPHSSIDLDMTYEEYLSSGS